MTEVPAKAGPFDLGTLAVRATLGLDPSTNRAVVRAQLPQFFAGAKLSYATSTSPSTAPASP